MNIVLYSRPFPPAVGGMERFAADLAGWLAARGHSVTVLTSAPAPGPGDGSLPYRLLRARPAFRQSREMRGADAVHVNGLSVRGIGLGLAARRPVVVTHAGHQAVCPTGMAWSPRGECTPTSGRAPCPACPSPRIPGAIRVALHRDAARRARRNVCVSHYLERRLGLRGASVVYNPVHRRAFDAASEGEGEADRVVFAGRLVREKGLDLLLQAMVHVGGVRLDVVGDGPMRSAWARLSRDVGLESRVRFHGSVPFGDLANLYARAAVVCVPSRLGEAFGYAAAEAMAMGRAVVATPRGALVELLAEGRGLIARECTAASLAEALSLALDGTRLRGQMGRRARAFAEAELAIETVGPRYEELLREAAG